MGGSPAVSGRKAVKSSMGKTCKRKKTNAGGHHHIPHGPLCLALDLAQEVEAQRVARVAAQFLAHVRLASGAVAHLPAAEAA